MSSRVEIQLGPVQETLLIPLFGRACQTRERTGLIDDPKSVEIVDSLDYDFSKWAKNSSLAGATIRSRIYDAQVRAFLNKHPQGTVVEIGAGLNTRYERLDNGQAQWLEFDLPDSMALRRAFFEDTDRRTMIEASVLDTDWHAKVRERPAPYFFVSEAVIIYLDELQAHNAIRGIAKAFPGSQMFFDTTCAKMVRKMNTGKMARLMPQNAKFRWPCGDPKSLESLGMTLKQSLTLLDLEESAFKNLPLSWKIPYKLIPWAMRRQIDGYRMNLFEFNAASTRA